MTITGPDIHSMIFSRSAPNIILSQVSGGPVQIRITHNGASTTYDINVNPSTKTCTIALREILRALEPNTIAQTIPASASPWIETFPDEITMEILIDGEVGGSWRGRFIPGFCKDSDVLQMLLNEQYWWTFRKQTAHTYRFSREYLTTGIEPYLEGHEIHIVFHFKNNGKKDIIWEPSHDPSAHKETFDVSYRRIRQIADTMGYADDEIIAYDVYGSTSSGSDRPIGQRFIVAPNNRKVRGFFFRNSLGAFDTVYSTGEISRAIESECKTFIASREELEISNLSHEVIKVDTGYIAAKAELNLWYEFLRSAERYAINSDGSISRIIVDGSDSEKTLSEAGSLNFRFRMSIENEGSDLTKSHLEEFSDEFT